MTKSELRKTYLEKRKTLSAGEIAAKSRQIAERFVATCDVRTVRVLHCFIPIKKFNEIDTSLIYQKIWTDHPEIGTAAPHTDLETGDMKDRMFTAKTQLTENTWGIREPVGGEIVAASEIGLVLVPLLCFDEKGYRVGYGKGFYDKFLPKCRPECLKVGLSYFPPVASIDDVGDHDIALDLCLTPNDSYNF